MKLQTTLKEPENHFEVHKNELTAIARGASIIFIGRIFESGLKYLYIIVVARILGAGPLGLFALGLTIISLAGFICRFGLDGGVIRYVAVYNGVGDKQRVKGTIVQALKYSFTMSVLVGVVLYLSAQTISVRIFNKPQLEEVIKFLSISLPFYSVIMIALSSIRGLQMVRYIVYTQDLFWPISALVLLVVFLLIGLKLNGVVLAHLLSILFTSGLTIYFLRKAFPQINQLKAIPETKKLLRFSIPLLLVVFLNFFINWTDTLMLGYFRSSKEVGIYNAAMRTALLAGLILSSFNFLFAPMISDLYHRKEHKKLEILFKTTCKWIYTATLPLFMLMWLLSKPIMNIFSEEFLPGWSALRILAFAQLVNAAVGPVGTILTMSGKQDLMMYNTLGISLFNIVLNFFLIPTFGITGAAIASGIAFILFNLIMLVEVYLLFNMHPFSLKFYKPTTCGLAIFGFIFFMDNMLLHLEAVSKLLVYIPLFLTGFILLIYIWGFDEEDILVINVFKNKLSKAIK